MWVHLNGRWVRRRDAALSVDDRGALLGDAVYEVIRVYGGRPFALPHHQERLARSLAGARMPTAPARDLPALVDGLIRRNDLREATIYCQIGRGAAPRQHHPPPGLVPTVLATPETAPAVLEADEPAALRGHLTPDLRWGRCAVKSVMLLPNVLATMDAATAGAEAALLHAGERITEAAAANVFAVKDGALRTHPADGAILPGVTRRVVLRLARERGWTIRYVPVGTRELFACEELFLTGTTTRIAAVTEVDGRAIGDGEAGPATRRLYAELLNRVARVARRSPRRERGRSRPAAVCWGKVATSR